MKKISQELVEIGASKSHYKLSYSTSLHGLIHCVLEEMRKLATSRQMAPWRCPKVFISGGCHVSFARDVELRERQKALWFEIVQHYACWYDNKANVWNISRGQ